MLPAGVDPRILNGRTPLERAEIELIAERSAPLPHGRTLPYAESIDDAVAFHEVWTRLRQIAPDAIPALIATTLARYEAEIETYRNIHAYARGIHKSFRKHQPFAVTLERARQERKRFYQELIALSLAEMKPDHPDLAAAVIKHHRMTTPAGLVLLDEYVHDEFALEIEDHPVLARLSTILAVGDEYRTRPDERIETIIKKYLD